MIMRKQIVRNTFALALLVLLSGKVPGSAGETENLEDVVMVDPEAASEDAITEGEYDLEVSSPLSGSGDSHDRGYTEGEIEEGIAKETDELGELLAMDIDIDIDVNLEDADADNRKKHNHEHVDAKNKDKSKDKKTDKKKTDKYTIKVEKVNKHLRWQVKTQITEDAVADGLRTPAPTSAPTSEPTECDRCNVKKCGCSQVEHSNYRGDLSVTYNGVTCQKWEDQFPHEHSYSPQDYPNSGLEENYCRNPDGEEGGLWCFTMDPDNEWDFCENPTCEDECCEDNCISDPTGCGCAESWQSDYRGTVAFTGTGERCEDWDMDGMVSNYCRNPDNSTGGAWCYTEDDWGYCEVPTCPINC